MNKIITSDLITEGDLQPLLEEVDPDWRDHFLTVEQGLRFYRDELKPFIRKIEKEKLEEQNKEFQAWALAIDADDNYINSLGD